MFLYSTKINMILIFISNTCIIASMDGNVVASESHYFTPKKKFWLKWTPSRRYYNFILFVNLHFIYHRIWCLYIAPMDDNVDASETHQFVPMNCLKKVLLFSFYF